MSVSHRADLGVALVSREYPPFFGGGIGTYARWIVPALTGAGVRVHVITEAHDRTNPRIEIDGLATIHRVPMGMGRGGWTNAAARFSINAGRVAAGLRRTGRIDVAEFAECEAAGLMPLLMRGRDRLPTVVQLHTPSEQLFALRSLSSRTLDAPLMTYFIAERMALRLADAVLAPSRFIARWAHQHYRLPACPEVIAYATGELPAAPAPASSHEPIVVFYAGRIEPRKGVESLVLAWNRVARAHPDARLHLAGADTSGAPDGGSMRAYLHELLDEHARPTVRFMGRLNQDALQDQYARASICVIPSLWENFPNTCIESMSSARAVLASDEGGMGEMIGGTDAGLTFTAGDEGDLSRKLDTLMREPRSRLAHRGRIARQRIERMCDPATIAKRRIEHYRRTIEQARSPRPDISRALLDSWSGLEQLGRGVRADIGLPGLSPTVGRWVGQEEGVAC